MQVPQKCLRYEILSALDDMHFFFFSENGRQSFALFKTTGTKAHFNFGKSTRKIINQIIDYCKRSEIEKNADDMVFY